MVKSSPNLHRSQKIHPEGEPADEDELTPFSAARGVLHDQAAIDSFLLSLHARGRSKATISTYLEALENLRRFAAHAGMPPLLAMSGEHLRSFFKELYDRGNKPGSVRNRWASLSAFFGWAEEEGELARGNPMDRVKPPQVPDQVLPHYALEDMQALLRSLPEKSSDESVLRDRAIILTLFDTGMRSAELCALPLNALNLRQRIVVVKGKGGKERLVGIGSSTAVTVDRYLRRRRMDAPWLFASKDGAPLKTSGLRSMLERRFQNAGVAFRGAHAFRRGFGISFLQAGGDPNDLKTLAGWNSYEMLRRYTKATESERGVDAHHRFSPADRLV